MKKNMKLKSFDFAESTSKQLITLSTAIVAFTITFGKELFGGIDNGFAFGVLITAWVFFVVSIICGVWTLMALTGSLDKAINIVKEKKGEQGSEKEVEVSIYDSNIRWPEFFQVLFFVLALSATIWYAIVLTTSAPEHVMQKTNSEIRIIRESTYTIHDSIKVDTLGFDESKIH